MNKEELKKIIIDELEKTWTHRAKLKADRILARIPNDDFEVIASGELEVDTNMIGEIKGCYIRNKEIGKRLIDEYLQEYEGKEIEVGIRVGGNK